MPNHSTRSGTSATVGVEYSALIGHSSAQSTGFTRAITTASGTPTTMANNSPQNRISRLSMA